MATGKSYDYIMEKAWKEGCRSDEFQGTMYIPLLLLSVGVKHFKRTDKKPRKGVKALVSFFYRYSPTGIQCHMMYWDGEEYNDPSNDPKLWTDLYRVIEIYDGN